MSSDFRKFRDIVSTYKTDDKVVGLKLRTQLGNEFVVLPKGASGWLGECTLSAQLDFPRGSIIALDPNTEFIVMSE